jgi:hypothetical protein
MLQEGAFFAARNNTRNPLKGPLFSETEETDYGGGQQDNYSGSGKVKTVCRAVMFWLP